jgi:hypothetical protein
MVSTHKEDTIGGLPKYEVESAFETLTRAREILKDPKKFAAVKIFAKKRIVATQEVAAQLNVEAKVGKKLANIFGD